MARRAAGKRHGKQTTANRSGRYSAIAESVVGRCRSPISKIGTRAALASATMPGPLEKAGGTDVGELPGVPGSTNARTSQPAASSAANGGSENAQRMPKKTIRGRCPRSLILRYDLYYYYVRTWRRVGAKAGAYGRSRRHADAGAA